MTWSTVSSCGLGHDPLAELQRWHREVDQLFGSRTLDGAGAMALNVWAGKDHVEVVAAVPDIEATALGITVEGGLLAIEGARKPEAGVDADTARRERAAGAFRREVRLPFEVDADRVTARYERGLVTITLPRSEQSKPRRIAVSAG